MTRNVRGRFMAACLLACAGSAPAENVCLLKKPVNPWAPQTGTPPRRVRGTGDGVRGAPVQRQSDGSRGRWENAGGGRVFPASLARKSVWPPLLEMPDHMRLGLYSTAIVSPVCRSFTTT